MTALADRVMETSATVGTIALTLAGTIAGYQAWATAFPAASALPVYYCIEDGTDWECGVGAFTAPSTLARTTVTASSNAGALVNFAAGTKRAFCAITNSAFAVAPRVPSVQSVVSAATVTPTFNDDVVKITAQAAALALANPTGTAIDCLGIVIRIKDNGTARAISYDTQYRAVGVTLPTTTVISKTLYLAMIFNTEDTKWDVLAVGQE